MQSRFQFLVSVFLFGLRSLIQWRLQMNSLGPSSPRITGKIQMLTMNRMDERLTMPIAQSCLVWRTKEQSLRADFSLGYSGSGSAPLKMTRKGVGA